MEATSKLLQAIQKYGEIETMLKAADIQNYDYRQELTEDREKADAKRTALSNQFLEQILGGQQGMGNQPQMGAQPMANGQQAA